MATIGRLVALSNGRFTPMAAKARLDRNVTVVALLPPIVSLALQRPIHYSRGSNLSISAFAEGFDQ